MLQNVITGKAQDTFSSLSNEVCEDYDTLQNAILRAYELVPESYKINVRRTKKDVNHTYVKFARVKEQLFDEWCRAKETDSLERLRKLILLEEFQEYS